jgi:hypothetical protein
MKHVCIPILTAMLAAMAPPAQAQGTVYRCGNEYTNNVRDAKDAQARGCKLVEGGNVTIIQAPRQGGNAGGGGSSAAPAVRAPTAAPAPSDNAEQRARESDTRMILESELRKAEARQADLLREYNNGEPEKMGSEARNYQKYLDRVADLKASIARNDSDIAGIKRELARLPSR